MAGLIWLFVQVAEHCMKLDTAQNKNRTNASFDASAYNSGDFNNREPKAAREEASDSWESKTA